MMIHPDSPRQRIILAALSAVLVCLGVYIFLTRSGKILEHEEVHHHAGFVVYIDGVLQDYSKFEHMKFSPCAAEAKTEKHNPAEGQLEKAHMHDMNGDVAHVHRQGATWGDFFRNSKISFPPDKEFVAYDGQQVIENFLDSEVLPDQSVVVTIGDQTQADTQRGKPVTIERIKEVEQLSENCGTSAL